MVGESINVNAETFQIWLNTFIMIGGLVTVSGLIYRITQRFSNIENRIQNHQEELNRLDKKINDARLEVKEARLVYKQELEDDISRTRDRLQKDLEEVKLSIKDSNVQSHGMQERIGAIQTMITHMDHTVERNYAFFTTWIQRIEDLISGIRLTKLMRSDLSNTNREGG